MNVVYNKRDYILPFKKYLNKPKKSVSFEQKVEFEYTYGKDAYDRKPIENMEQITIRELYELTLSRIEARKSNVYYSNKKAPNTDISDCINDDSISEEKKVKIVGEAEKEKLNNMEVDELENKSKNSKKIKLDFNKTNPLKEEEAKDLKNGGNGMEEDEKMNNNDDTLIEEDSAIAIPPEQNNKNNLDNKILKDDPLTPISNSNEADHFDETKPITENDNDETDSIKENKPNAYDESIFSPEDSKNGNSNNNANHQPELLSPRAVESPKENKDIFLPNGEINYKNLPPRYKSPKRIDSKNRRMNGGGVNFYLAHYKPPIKSLAEINDPNYEEKVGSEPVPYGSSVFYDEPDVTSPNMENAIPVYHRPMMNYRNNLMNITNGNELEPIQPPSMPNEEPSMEKPKEHEKKSKDKKSNRKSLSIFNILKKSKSAENIKVKSRMSFFKPVTKNHSSPVNESSLLDNKSKPHHSPSPSPLSKTQNASNENKGSSMNTGFSRVSIFNKFEEPSLDELISKGPGFEKESKPMSNYAKKSLKLRKSDSSLQVNTSNLLGVPANSNHLRPISPISVKSFHSVQSTHSNSFESEPFEHLQSPNESPSMKTPVSIKNNSPKSKSTNTYVPNILLD